MMAGYIYYRLDIGNIQNGCNTARTPHKLVLTTGWQQETRVMLLLVIFWLSTLLCWWACEPLQTSDCLVCHAEWAQ